MENLTFTVDKELESNTTFFMQNSTEILKLCFNGDIYVHGRLAENDKEVVDALRDFLKSQNLIK